jgi:hypothetical protein
MEMMVRRTTAGWVVKKAELMSVRRVMGMKVCAAILRMLTGN